ncbi:MULTISPECIES: hypothetical protein [Stenotrophomonas]|uniref:hypothetical protein n=1 Tax=Stenotrophomonas TaxID=40323 RepID=UPI00066BFC27|nr:MULTISPECIES: hypothetical protein [Stenotrophomonas]MDH2179193.1 hypothetical protein [Stenotrophomonas sp. GD03654]HDS1084710.1 hypothetical protein [Stenotrophomonas maltophilia]
MTIGIRLFPLLAVMAALPATAQVVDVNVTGEFRPNALDPGDTAFRNTTPRGSFCNWRPAECDRNGAYIFDLGNREYWRKQGPSDDTSRRDTTYIRFPPPRTITLQEVSSGRTFEATISFAALSMRINFGGGADPWYYGVSGGCTAIRGAGGLGFSLGGWAARTPASPTECYSTRTRYARTYSYRNVGLGIHVTLPNAMTLQDGRYVAQETWTTGGAGADIDLGDNITGVEAVRMNFVFDVIHDFQVRFATEAPRVQLAPEGGWSPWIDHGTAPVRLRQELPFHLTTSMDFSMKLRCQHHVGDQCGIHDPRADKQVPVGVDVTLPGMSNLRDGRPAQNTVLLADDGQAPRFTPDGYLMQRRSTLRFTAGRDAVLEMVKTPGSRWEGDMTVLFDANP